MSGYKDSSFRILHRAQTRFEKKFSVIIVTYNRLLYLLSLLDRLVEQRYSAPFEVVVVDNGSAPFSSEPLIQSLMRFPDHILLRRSWNVFGTDPWIAALQQASGQYVLFPGDDDQPRYNYLATFAKFAERSDVALVGTAMKHVDADLTPIGKWSIPPRFKGRGDFLGQMLVKNHLSMPATAARRDLLNLEEIPSSRFALDWAMWLMAGSQGRTETSTTVTIDYRVHAGQEYSEFPKFSTRLEGARATLGFLLGTQFDSALQELSDEDIRTIATTVLNSDGLNHGEEEWSPLLQAVLTDRLARRLDPVLGYRLLSQVYERRGKPVDIRSVETALNTPLQQDSEALDRLLPGGPRVSLGVFKSKFSRRVIKLAILRSWFWVRRLGGT